MPIFLKKVLFLLFSRECKNFLCGNVLVKLLRWYIGIILDLIPWQRLPTLLRDFAVQIFFTLLIFGKK